MCQAPPLSRLRENAGEVCPFLASSFRFLCQCFKSVYFLLHLQLDSIFQLFHLFFLSLHFCLHYLHFLLHFLHFFFRCFHFFFCWGLVAVHLLIEVVELFLSNLLSLHSLLLQYLLHSLFYSFFQFLHFLVQLFLFLPVQKLLVLFIQLAFHLFHPFYFFFPDLVLGSHPIDEFQADVTEGSQSLAVDFADVGQYVNHLFGSSLQPFFPGTFPLSQVFSSILQCLLLWGLWP